MCTCLDRMIGTLTCEESAEAGGSNPRRSRLGQGDKAALRAVARQAELEVVRAAAILFRVLFYVEDDRRLAAGRREAQVGDVSDPGGA